MIFICATLTTSKSTNTSTFVNFIHTSSSYGSNWDQVASNNYTFSNPTYGGYSSFSLGNTLMSESGKYILYNNFITVSICQNANSGPCNAGYHQAILYISSSFGQSWYYIDLYKFLYYNKNI